MSKMKSRLRPTVKKTVPSQTWCIDVYEHEIGWGLRPEYHFEFPSEEKALKYIQKANTVFYKNGNMDYFSLAHPPIKTHEITG
ncbi:hypothetical protein [Diaphorobacter nitroreducens]|uniref:hypothetical protein n=1 Tax=Diaphorobacter nitroreducens TaxID=164759 RepID=UPI00289CD745|nr:hypothetical protein [Diaphorobacter nitroreducens]